MRFLKGYFNAGWEEKSNHNLLPENIQEDNVSIQTETTCDFTYHAKQLSKGLLLFGAGVAGYLALNAFWKSGREDKTLKAISDVDDPLTPPSLVELSFSTRREIISTEQGCAEFQINTYTTLTQDFPSVTGLTNGGFVVTWESDIQDGSSYGVYGQLYNSTAGRVGDEFQISTYTTNTQNFPSVTSLTNGSFVVIWMSSLGQDGDEYGVYGQLYNSTADKVGDEFQVNTYTTNNQHYPTVASLANGGFVVTWGSVGQDGDIYGAFGQLYNALAGEVGVEFQINTYTSLSQASPQVAGLTNAGFVVVWTTTAVQDGDGYGVYGQLYNSTAGRVGSEFQVNTYTTSDQQFVSTSSLTTGGFVVVWGSDAQDGNGYGIYGQLYNSTAGKVGVEFQVNSYTIGSQSEPSVVGLTNDAFLVTWHSYDQDGSFDGIYGQRYNSTGGKVDAEFQINIYTTSEQAFSSVASLTNGGFVVTWSSNDQDGDLKGVYGRLSAPCLVTNGLTVNEGETVFLNPTFLDATAMGASDSLLNFTVVNVQHGIFDKLSSTGVSLFSFTKEEILNSQIRFVHDDSEIAPSYDVKVSDGVYETPYQAAAITFTNINDQPPLLINNQLTVSQDGRVSLDYTMLKATDPDTNDAGLVFIVDNIQHGFFEEAIQGKTITNFTQQEITDKNIWFFHDGSNQSPSYRVKVSDGQLETSYQSAEIIFEPTKTNLDWLVPVLVTSGAAGGAVLFCVAGCVCLVTIGGIFLTKGNKNNLNRRMSMHEVEMAAIDGPLTVSPLMQKFLVEENEITLVRMIGQGGEAVVYEAKWSNKTVAYKVTPILDSGAISEFEKEAQIMLESNHPRIVSVYRICLLPRKIGLVMEFMKLGSLKEAIANPEFELTWESKWNIAYDLASVISFLHGEDTVHRDIKPDNLLLCREEGELHAKLADFGLSKMRQGAEVSVTMGLGTYKYMAPEMVLGDGHYSEEATDIYAIGMTLVSLINREEPYPDLGNAMNIPANVGVGKLWQTLSKNNCSPAFFKLINQCRDIEADERPSAKQITKELEDMKDTVLNFKEHREGNEELSSQELMANMSV